jgi:hypothetical protein
MKNPAPLPPLPARTISKLGGKKMKFRIPQYKYIMIPAAIVVILLMILFWVKIPLLITPLVKWMVKHNFKPSVIWFPVAAILILVITGSLVWGIVVFISRLEDRYIQKHQPPVNPAEAHGNEIDDILCSVEQSLAKIKESSERMKAQTEQIMELNRRFLGGSIAPPQEPPNLEKIPPPHISRHEISPHGRMISDRLIGSADIYVLGGSKDSFPKKENSPDYRGISPEKTPEFIALIEKITCLLRYSIKE